MTVDLDDAQALRTLDPSDMLGAVAAMHRDVREAYANGRGAGDLPQMDGISSIVFCGMGGSAVAGDILKQAFRDRLAVPVDVNRSPVLPRFADSGALVVVSSYSGNTSETLSAFGAAVDRGCRILAITSGGSLASICAERGLAAVCVPGGFQPRAALGHLTLAMLGALEAAGLLPALAADVDEAAAKLETSGLHLGAEVPTSKNPAKEVAAWLGDRVPVIWGAEGIGSVAAMRWKTQMNENGKVPAFHAAMSELDHNELVGWVKPFGERFGVIVLLHGDQHEEHDARFPLSIDVARDAGAEVRSVDVGSGSTLASLLTLIAIGDFVSCYVGLRRGVDPTPVTVIDRLKAALAAA